MSRTTVREVKPEDIGWLAGIIDGEGSITIVSGHTKPRKIIHNIHIVGTNLQLIEKCKRIVDCFDDGKGWKRQTHKIYLKKYKTNIFKKNPKPCYHIQIYRQGVLKNLLQVILPHLTEKYLRGARLLNFLENHKRATHFQEGEIDAFLNFTPAETK